MGSVRDNVLVDLTTELEETIVVQPTAYDVDKVVEQLKKRLCSETDAAMSASCAMRNKHFKDAIEIVKAGGVDEQINTKR